MYCNDMSAFSINSISYLEEEEIVEKYQNVIINKEGVRKLATEAIEWHKKQEINMGKKYLRHSRDFPNCYDYRSADWLFVLNTLNFFLHDSKKTKQWTVNGFTGYPALCSAMKRAIEKKKPIWNPRYYVNLKIDEIEELFRGDDGTCIPMIGTRLKILHDVGRILVDKYNGTFLTCINLCNYNAKILIFLLTREFKYYEDKEIYDKEIVYLPKTNAKILINDLRFYFPIDTTTCLMTPTLFNDRTFNILFQYDVLRYSETFEKTLNACDDLEYVDYINTEELELHSCVIVAIKMMCKEIQENPEFLHIMSDLKPFNIPILIDNFLFKIFYGERSDI